jgi:hypothetical protein
MQVAQWAAGKNGSVTLLPPTILYLLSTPSTPTHFVTDILNRAAAGENISPSDIREELREMRAKVRKKQHRTASTIQSTQAGQTSGQTAEKAGNEADIQDAIAILARVLSLPDFCRVRDIMTNKRVLSDPYLAQNIVSAFSASRETDGAPDRHHDPELDCDIRSPSVDVDSDCRNGESET